MIEQTRDRSTTRKHRRRLALSTVALGLLIVAVAFVWSLSRPPDMEESLAAIEAARAIPDSENAATVYDYLLGDPNATSLLDHRPEFLDEPTWNRTLTESWPAADYPDLAEWIGDHQYVIDKLLDAAGFEKCRFPILIDIDQTAFHVERMKSMRQWTFLLMFASNNDLAEGRIDAAIAKWQCIVQMADHLRQQPLIIDQLCADGIARRVWANIARFVVEGAFRETHLQKIEAITLQTTTNREDNLEDIRAIKDLPTQRLLERFGPLERLKFRISAWRTGELEGRPGLDDVRRTYLRHTATTRGIRMLIVLRLHKNEFGTWPRKLNEIRSQVPSQVLVDPLNNGGFVYRLTKGGFKLYSCGKNKMDEDGQFSGDPKKGPDDWPIWPPRGYRAQGESSRSR